MNATEALKLLKEGKTLRCNTVKGFFNLSHGIIEFNCGKNCCMWSLNEEQFLDLYELDDFYIDQCIE